MHTSKRMHFIEDRDGADAERELAALHTSKRMHFIEDLRTSSLSECLWELAYVKTYALH